MLGWPTGLQGEGKTVGQMKRPENLALTKSKSKSTSGAMLKYVTWFVIAKALVAFGSFSTSSGSIRANRDADIILKWCVLSVFWEMFYVEMKR